MAYQDRRKGGTEEFLREARDRFRLASEAEHRLRKEMLEDLRFTIGDQWPEEIRKQRDMDRRPCLTINRLPQFIHQVTNEIKQNRPSALVRPVEDNDAEVAEVYQGLIRHIERQSKADRVRSYAATFAAITGRGFYRVRSDYASHDSFDQELYVERIKNQMAVYFDPTAKEPDYSDAGYAFIVDDPTHDQYREMFPGSELSGLTDFESIGDRVPGWATRDTIRIAEYFCVHKKKAKLALLEDGSSIILTGAPGEDELPTVRTRDTEIPAVRWTLINGAEILEERDWPGMWIPIIPVLGEELDVDGETHLIGMVRNSRDPQRMYNYWASAETETIALAPRAPYIGATGQFEGHEDRWAMANSRNLAYLEYNPQGVNGHPLPPPVRQVFEPPIQAITQARMQSADDLKSTMGIYDAALGARSNEQSGKAILARQNEADVSNYHFVDALSTAITHEARILIDLIPKIYDRPGRVVRIIGEEDDERTVTLNQPHMDKGVEKIYDLSTGRYDVSVQVGPSYKTQRQEAAEAMIELTRSMPVIGNAAPDLVVKVLDMPGAKELAERLKRALPPGLADADDQQQIPPAAKAQIDQSMQMVDALAQQVNALMDELESKRAEIESKERIEAAKIDLQRDQLQAQMTIEQMKIASQEELALLKAEMEAIKQRQATAQAEAQMQMQTEEADKDRAFQAEQTDVQAAQQAAATQQDQAFQAESADADRAFQSEQAQFQAATAAEQADADRAFQSEQADKAAKAAATAAKQKAK
jgi:hypothetical protein